MNSDTAVGDINYFIELAATTLLEAKSSDEDVVTYARTRMQADVVQAIDDVCDNTRRSRRDTKTGMVLHGFHIFLGYLNENDLLYPFTAYNDVYRYFKHEWNDKGEECLFNPSLVQRHITFDNESIASHRKRYTFSMSAKRAAAMEKVFRLLKLSMSDGYAVCFLLSLYNMESRYRKFALSDIGYLRSVTTRLFREITIDSRKCKQWISDCDLNTFDSSIRHALNIYSTTDDGKRLSDYRDRVINIIDGCRIAEKYMNSLGFHQMETELTQLTELFISDFYVVDNTRVSIKADDVWVPMVDEMNRIVYVAEDSKQHHIVYHGITSKGEFIAQKYDNAQFSETPDVKIEPILTNNDDDNMVVTYNTTDDSFLGKCKRVFNIIRGTE